MRANRLWFSFSPRENAQRKQKRKPKRSTPLANQMARQHQRTTRRKGMPMNVQLLQEAVELNQAFERVIEGLKRMEKVSFLQAAMVREDRAEVVLAQIDFNRLFFGDLHMDYERDEKWAADFQRACLTKRCDP